MTLSRLIPALFTRMSSPPELALAPPPICAAQGPSNPPAASGDNRLFTFQGDHAVAASTGVGLNLAPHMPQYSNCAGMPLIPHCAHFCAYGPQRNSLDPGG